MLVQTLTRLFHPLTQRAPVAAACLALATATSLTFVLCGLSRQSGLEVARLGASPGGKPAMALPGAATGTIVKTAKTSKVKEPAAVRREARASSLASVKPHTRPVSSWNIALLMLLVSLSLTLAARRTPPVST